MAAVTRRVKRRKQEGTLMATVAVARMNIILEYEEEEGSRVKDEDDHDDDDNPPTH